MTSSAIARVSVEEYLACEETSETKHEFYDGQMFAMAGGSRNHSRIASEAQRLIENALVESDSDCTTFNSDMQVLCPSGLYTYPDMIVACEEQDFTSDKQTTLVNPRVLIEVLSPSTAEYDQHTKLRMYRAIESLTDYVIVWQDRVRVLHHRINWPEPGSWTGREWNDADDHLTLASIGVRIRIGDLYRRVSLPDPPPPDAELRPRPGEPDSF